MKHQITTSLIALLLVCNAIAYGSDKNPKSVAYFSDSTEKHALYFIAGTLSDYMGRFWYVNRTNQIDRYFPYEKPVQDYVNALIKTAFNEEVEGVNSNRIAPLLNAFYDEKGLLIDSLFKNKDLNLSFLTGLYFRYGTNFNDTIYKIQVANSPNSETYQKLLKRVDCDKIFFQRLNNIPVQYLFYFEPTQKLKQRLDAMLPYKTELERSFLHMVSELVKTNAETDFAINKLKELAQVHSAFSQ